MSKKFVASCAGRCTSLGGDAGIDALLREAACALEHGDSQSAISLFTEARYRSPTSARAAFLLGTCLLNCNSSLGLDHLKFAMAQDETATGAACARALDYLRSTNDEVAVEGFRRKLAAWNDALAMDEGMPLTGDILVEPAAAHRDAIAAHLSNVKCGLAFAYVVEQVLPEWHEKNALWLVARARGADTGGASLSTSLLRMKMQAYTDADVKVLVATEYDVPLVERLRALPGACLWDREAGSPGTTRAVTN